MCLASVLAMAVEVRLDLPDQIVPNAVINGAVEIVAPTGNITAVELPDTPGVAWQMTNRNGVSSINGRTTVSVGIALRAEKLGDIELPPVNVRMSDGNAASSAPRTIHVTSGDPTLVGEAVASCRFDPASIVPGQPTSLVYRVCTAQGAITKADIAPPDGAISLGEPTVEKGRAMDAKGRTWTVTTITWSVTHATPGTYHVGGQQTYEVALDDFGMRVRRRQVAVAPATLTVEALPEDGRPADFSGLIGPIAATAALERTRVSTGEGTVLSVSIAGRQTGLARRPPLTLHGAQVYPKDEAEQATGRVFRWDIVPGTPGTITVPALRFPYFDPGSRSYRTADSEPLQLTVLPGRNRDLGVVGAPLAHAPAAQPSAVQHGLPAPLRGSVGPSPPRWAASAAAAAGLAAILATALILRFSRGRPPHRGRRLRAAGSDPVALGQALAALRPALTTPEQRAAAAALEDAIDRNRFGGERMPDPTPWVRALEDVP